MPKIPQVKSRQVIKVLIKSGFTSRPGKGSHTVFSHKDGRRTIVPNHSKPLAKGTLNAILKQAKLSVGELLKLLKK